MQIKKEEVKEKIIRIAKQEFMELGFERASIRKIAKLAGVTTGNIYIYFKNKNELFKEIIKPAVEFIESSMSVEADSKKIKDYIANNLSSADETFSSNKIFLEDVLKHKTELNLILFKSAGSAYAGYKEHMIRMYAEGLDLVTDIASEKSGGRKLEFTEMFKHSRAALFISMIEETLLHEPDDEELKIYMKEIAIFAHHGLQHLIEDQIKNQK